jgi:hypothetical protein
LTSKRFQLLQELDQFIQNKTTGDSNEFAKQLGISRSTLFEYLGLLKELGAPIQYDRAACTFYYVDHGKFYFEFKRKIISGESGNIAG